MSPLERADAALHDRHMYALDHAGIATPAGFVTVLSDERWITAVRIDATGTPRRGTTGPVRTAAEQLAAWFAAERTHFDLPLEPARTLRGEALRQGMIAIPHGSVLSYGALARKTGSSARAIGQACARNPFPIVVPCHRVNNADGSLGAYSGGDGPPTKRWLLAFEQAPLRLL